MFQFSGLASDLRRILYLQYSELSHSQILEYNARVQLSQAYRSLPRPSSPLRPKASTIRPYVALKKFEIAVVCYHHSSITTTCKLLIRFPNMSKSFNQDFNQMILMLLLMLCHVNGLEPF